MRFKPSVMLIAASFCLATVAHAKDGETEEITFIGTGNLSCGEFIKAKEDRNTAQLDLFVQWSWGFMSGYAMRDHFTTKWKGSSKSGALSSLPKSETVLLFLEKHCREHPLDTVLTGTVALTRALGGNVIW